MSADDAYKFAQIRIERVMSNGSTKLDLSFGETRNLRHIPTEITALKNIEHICLNGTKITDLTLLTGLSSLRTLQLNGTNVSDLKPLAELISLNLLWLDDTQVTDLSPISKLTDLETLWLDGTKISDLKALSMLKKLKTLRIPRTAIEDLDPLSELSNLEILQIDETQVSDLKPLSKLKSLKNLSLVRTQVADLDVLSELATLGDPEDMIVLHFGGSAAAKNDANLKDISLIKNDQKRTQKLLDYLELWQWPVFDKSTLSQYDSDLPETPQEKIAPLQTTFENGKMVRVAPKNIPKDEVMDRAKQGWQSLHDYHNSFVNSFNLDNYAQLRSMLNAYDRAIGQEFDPKRMIQMGVMGTRIINISENKDFVATLPDGTDTDLLGYAAEISTYLNRFPDWLSYKEDAIDGRVSSEDVKSEVDAFDQISKSLRKAPEVSSDVSSEFEASLGEAISDNADEDVSSGFADSTRELTRELSEKALEGVRSGEIVRESIQKMDDVADAEFAKLKFWSYGWTLVLLKRNQAPLRKIIKRFPQKLEWLEKVLDYLFGLDKS